MRSMYGRYPEYHTSLDDKSVINFEALERTVEVYFEIVRWHERNQLWINCHPECEPQLGIRGLYPNQGVMRLEQDQVKVIMWLLSFSDGEHGILDVANKSGVTAEYVEHVAEILQMHGLLRKLDE